jgi:hypothetical protein
LDMAVATQALCDRFPAYKVIHGDLRHSDHRPIILETHGSEGEEEVRLGDICRNLKLNGLKKRILRI